MKYIISIFLILLSCQFSKASPIVFERCIPENNSEITDFNFTIVFDISDAIKVLGNDFGIAYNGSSRSSSKLKTSLYEGTPEGAHTLLAKDLTSNYDGKSADFQVGNNRVKLSFPQTLIPEAGKDYYLEIGNIFFLCKLGDDNGDDSSMLSFKDSPLILQFKGRTASSTELVFQNASISDNEVIESLSDVSYTFNEPIKITANPYVNVVGADGTSVSVTSAKIQSDGKTVTFSASPAINLLRKQPYDIVLQEGSVCLQSDESVVSKSVTIKVTGNYATPCKVSETSIENNSIGLYQKLGVTFDIPQGLTLVPPRPNIDIPLNGYLYKDAVSDENLVSTFKYEATASNTIEWNMTDFPFEPETKYIFVKDKNNITLFNENGVSVPYYGNDRIEIAWTTPTVAESGIPQFEFQTPEVFVGSKNSYSYKENMKLSNISSIRLTLKDYNYIYEGKSYKLARRISNQIPQCQIYEVTGNGDVLLYDMYVDTQQRETSTEYYNSISAYVNLQLLEGKKYKVVIPEGLFVPQNMPALKGYVTNPRFEFMFEGAGASEIVPASCNVESGAYLRQLYNVVWEFDTPLSLVGDNPTAQSIMVTSSGNSSTENKNLRLTDFYGKSYLKIDYTDDLKGFAKTIFKDWKLTVTIPEGTICYASDPGLVNKEFSIVINGKDADPIVSAPEFVNVEFSADELIAANTTAVKGEKVTIQITPDEYWKVSELTRDNDNVLAKLENGSYTTPKLTDNTSIKAKLAYVGKLIVSETSGVAQLPDSNIKVYTENGDIVIDGLAGGEHIVIYSISGMVIGNHDATKDTVRISVDPGQYIVRIGKIAVKLAI